VWGDYEWAEGRKYLIIKNIRLVTFTNRLTRLGVPRSTVYRLIKNGAVKAELIDFGDWEKYVIDTASLYEALRDVLEDALKRSAKMKKVANRVALARSRAQLLGIEYDPKLADDEYYERKRKEIEEEKMRIANELREKIMSAPERDRILSLLILLNRRAKINPALYDLKDRVLQKILPWARKVRYLRADISYYDLWEIEFEYRGPLQTLWDGVASFHIPVPRIRGTDFEKTLKSMCQEKGWRDAYSYGRPPTDIELKIFTEEEIKTMIKEFLEKTPTSFEGKRD